MIVSTIVVVVVIIEITGLGHTEVVGYGGNESVFTDQDLGIVDRVVGPSQEVEAPEA